MNRNDTKCQQIIARWDIGRALILDHIDDLILAIESEELNRSLSEAVTWFNRFERASDCGAKDFIGICPAWIIEGI